MHFNTAHSYYSYFHAHVCKPFPSIQLLSLRAKCFWAEPDPPILNSENMLIHPI